MLFSPQLLVRNQPKIVTGGALGLQTNLTGFWSLENTSWTDDTASGTTLTATGTPTASAGKVGNAADFDGSTDGLGAASNANILNGGSSFSVQAWVSIGSPPGEWQVFNKDSTSFGQREWGLGTRFTSSNVWVFTCSNTSTTLFRADAAANHSSGWHHLVGTFNSSGGAMVLYVDGSASGAGNTLTGTMNSHASAPLGIGQQNTAPIGTACLIDQCGFWKGRVLSAGDVTALYNSGNGLSYEAMA